MKAAMLLLAAAATAAPDPTPAWQGVWQGTVGDLPVRACLARRGESYTVGAYYYLSRLRPIRLEQQGGSREWLEGWGTSSGPPRPRWRFGTVTAGVLAGSWQDGGRTLSFRLTRAASQAAADDEPCGSIAFNQPRLRPLRVTAAPATQDGVAYRKLTFHPGPAFDSVELRSFALAGDTPATRRINARLRRDMPIAAAQGDWYDCVAGALDSQGTDGDYDAALTPTLISARWLAVNEANGGDCGGAHPSTSSTSLVFDRTTGAEVDLYGWLTAAAVSREHLAGVTDEVRTVRPALRRLILARAGPADGDCAGVAADEEFWDIGLTRRGLSFTPVLAHVVQACAETTVVPWQVLAPFLTPQGRAGAASLR